MTTHITGTTGRLVDAAGRPVRLGPVLGKGGEGTVYEIVGEPTRVAKIYHDRSQAKAPKLAAMVNLGTQQTKLLKMSAWPERTLHEPSSKAVRGFVMPRVKGASLSDLLGPGSRRAQFPHATFTFVVLAAKNLATAFAAAHDADAVIGDVKEINAFVDEEAIVTLLDTDGFQIPNPKGGVFHTLAITPSHQPPELQGIRELTRISREPHHDAFGLAVLVFQLLFMGRHPFAGTPVGNRDLEIHDAIKEFQFAWAPELPKRVYQQPRATLSLSASDRWHRCSSAHSSPPRGPLGLRRRSGHWRCRPTESHCGNAL